MNIEEIRKNAPKGATHIDKEKDYWHVVSDDELYFYWDGWVRYLFTLDRAIKKFRIKPL